MNETITFQIRKLIAFNHGRTDLSNLGIAYSMAYFLSFFELADFLAHEDNDEAYKIALRKEGYTK